MPLRAYWWMPYCGAPRSDAGFVVCSYMAHYLLYLPMEIAGGLMLFTAGAFAITAWKMAQRRRGEHYWLLFGSGLVFLAADELFSFHERLGRSTATSG